MLKFLYENRYLEEGNWTFTKRNSGKPVKEFKRSGVYCVKEANKSYKPVRLSSLLHFSLKKRYLEENQIPYELPVQSVLDASTSDQTFVSFDAVVQTKHPELKVVAKVKLGANVCLTLC